MLAMIVLVVDLILRRMVHRLAMNCWLLADTVYRG